MLDYLNDVLKRLPTLLQEPLETWNSVFVNYHEPFVERLWRQDGENRIYLHRIQSVSPGASPLFHPHPWPSAMKIMEGDYEMGIGHGPGIVAPPVTMKLILSDHSVYEMIDIDSWHYVSPVPNTQYGFPVSSVSYSVMVTGKPWNREIPKGPTIVLEPLSFDKKHSLRNKFLKWFSTAEI